MAGQLVVVTERNRVGRAGGGLDVGRVGHLDLGLAGELGDRAEDLHEVTGLDRHGAGREGLPDEDAIGRGPDVEVHGPTCALGLQVEPEEATAG